MEEDANSWLRRTKFSNTVYHPLDSRRIASFPSTRHQNSCLRSRPESSPAPTAQQSGSSLPETSLSEAFKEPKSDQKRFSTPLPHGKSSNQKGIIGKLFRQSSHQIHTSKSTSHFNLSPIRHFGSMKLRDKNKNRSKNESAWTKYFDHGGGKVNAVETADEWTVDLTKLFLGERFAQGAHSRLYHGLYKDEPVAVKIVRVPDDDENGAMATVLQNQFNREVALLSRLRHPNVIKFIAAWKNPPVFCIVTEYLSEGSLRSYLHKLEHKSLGLQKTISIALDIARGMQFLHSQGVIHRDLKPENILIDQDFHMKIADFGIACEEFNSDFPADDPGTYRWMAPEMINQEPFGRKVDVYSFGLILSEMVSGFIPYEDMTPIQAAFAVVSRNLRPEIDEDCPPAMRALIEHCWSLQPEKRPEFWQVVKVLEQFESCLATDETLSLVQYPLHKYHKKRVLRWIKKLTLVSKSKFV